MKYRKRPVVIEAVQLRWDTWNEICDLINNTGSPVLGCYIGPNGEPLPEGETSDIIGVRIPTLEGEMLGRQNDYIIRGVHNELYPCKPNVFDLTYEKVDE